MRTQNETVHIHKIRVMSTELEYLDEFGNKIYKKNMIGNLSGTQTGFWKKSAQTKRFHATVPLEKKQCSLFCLI
jgi:hypothetical protein